MLQNLNLLPVVPSINVLLFPSSILRNDRCIHVIPVSERSFQLGQKIASVERESWHTKQHDVLQTFQQCPLYQHLAQHIFLFYFAPSFSL
jgi:hypothetical protein